MPNNNFDNNNSAIIKKPSHCFARDNFDFIARMLVLLGIFFIPLSSGIVNKFFPAAVFCTLLAGNWAYKWSLIKKERVIILGLVFLGFVFVGIFYSQGTLHYTLRGLFKYTKIAYLLILLPLFIEYKWRRLAENALMISVFINLVVALLNVYGIPVFGKTADVVGSYFIHQIYTSALTAFVAFILANRMLDDCKCKYRWIYGILLIFSIYALFFVYIERTGYVIFFALFMVFLAQRMKWKGVVITLLLIPLFIGMVYYVSPVFHKRINDVVSDLTEYSKQNERTSIGFRMAFVKYSFKVIKECPIFGLGTGSFPEVYHTTGGPLIDENAFVGDPHDEYIQILFQNGLLGLSLFLLWIAAMWKDSFLLPLQEQRLVQGLIVGFIVNGFCKTSLSINSTGMLLIVFLGIYFASKKTIIDCDAVPKPHST